MPETFEDKLIELINRFSEENKSDTPDYILADYIMGCLENFYLTVGARDKWYSRPTTQWYKEMMREYQFHV